MFQKFKINIAVRNRIWKYIEKISSDDIVVQSAALAYFSMLAMVPIFIIVLSLLSLLNSDLQEQLKIQALHIAGSDIYNILILIIQSAHKRPDLSVLAGWVAIVLLAASGSVVFAHMHASLNKIFKVKKTELGGAGLIPQLKNIIVRRLFSVIILLSFIVFFIVSLIVSQILMNMWGSAKGFIVDFVTVFFNIAGFSIFFSIIYKWIPDRDIRFSKSFPAGVLAAIIFIVGKSLITVYIMQLAIRSAYGAIGSLVLLLIWIYYSIFVFFLGAEYLEISLNNIDTKKK